jgi:glycosyltransferase involved in cell wall biosynthesis
VAVGDEIRSFLVRSARLRPDRAHVIRNGINLDVFQPRPGAARSDLGLPEKGPLVAHVARLAPEKDQETLLRGFQVLARDCLEATLIIVGDGPRRATLGALAADLAIADRVAFLGMRRDVAALLPHVALFVLTSVNEGLPLSVLEAMACGVPVVATAVGDVGTVVRDGLNGLTVPVRDPEALARAMLSILEAPDRAAGMGRAGRQLVEREFSLTTTVERYQSLYEELCR